MVNEGQTKLVLNYSNNKVAKIYKWEIQFEQEREFYSIFSKAGYASLLATSIFYPCYSIQEKLTPLTCDRDIPLHLSKIIYDSGAAQFGIDKKGTVKIIDFENVNLESLKLQGGKNLTSIFKKKGKG
jgi:hypothetical protein